MNICHSKTGREKLTGLQVPGSPSSFGTSIPCSALSFFMTSPSFASPSSDIDAVSFFMMTCTSVLNTQDSANPVQTGKNHRNLEKVSHLDCRHCGYTAICRKSWLLCIAGSVHVCRHGYVLWLMRLRLTNQKVCMMCLPRCGYHFMFVIYPPSRKTAQKITKDILYITLWSQPSHFSRLAKQVLWFSSPYQWSLLCCKWCRPVSCFIMKCCVSHGLKRRWVVNCFHDCKIRWDVDLGQHLPFHHSSNHFNSWCAQKQSPWKTCPGFGFGTCGVRLCLHSKSEKHDTYWPVHVTAIHWTYLWCLGAGGCTGGWSERRRCTWTWRCLNGKMANESQWESMGKQIVVRMQCSASKLPGNMVRCSLNGRLAFSELRKPSSRWWTCLWQTEIFWGPIMISSKSLLDHESWSWNWR